MGAKSKNNQAMSAFPPAALACLLQAEWMPNRTVSTHVYERAYAAEGLRFLPKTKQFLREFGGMIIRYVTKYRQEDVLEFLAERAAKGMGSSGVKCFEELTGVAPLCPIGHYSSGTCMLFMDGQGRIFGGSDETVTFIGETGMGAISNILTGAEAEVLEPRAP